MEHGPPAQQDNKLQGVQVISTATTNAISNCFAAALLLVNLLTTAVPGIAQTLPVSPAPDATCVATALNRNATMDGDYYMIPGVPALAGMYRVRGLCSDGTVGETKLVTPDPNGVQLNAGPIVWGSVTSIPDTLILDVPSDMTFGQAYQLTTTAIGIDGVRRNVTARATGTNYQLSNPNIADISADGKLIVYEFTNVKIFSQLIVSAVNEGTAVSRVIQLGPRSTLSGTVTLADGVSVVAGANVTIQRNSPLSTFPVRKTDSAGLFKLDGAPAGDYTVWAEDPVSGTRARIHPTLLATGEPQQFNIRLGGKGNITVRVLGGDDLPVPNAQVTVAHTQYAGVFAAGASDSSGVSAFSALLEGNFSVTVQGPLGGAVAAASVALVNGANLQLTMRLQSVGTILGRVLGMDGVSPQAGVQVRLLSASLGIVSQGVSNAMGDFKFNSVFVGAGPYSLQALKDGKIQGGKANLILTTPNQELKQDIVYGQFSAGARIVGRVSNELRIVQAGAQVTVVTANNQQLTASTNAQGEYLFDAVPLGKFSITAQHNGFSASSNGNANFDGEQLTVDLKLAAVGQVKGRLLLSGGLPAGDTPMELRLAAGSRRITTDADGVFQFADVPLGAYTLLALHAGSGEPGLLSGVLDTPGAVQERELKLLPVGSLVVRVLTDTAPLINARVFLALEGAYPYGAEAVTDADGIVTFTAVPKSPYMLTVLGGSPNAPLNGIHMAVLEQASSSVTVRMRPALSTRYTIAGQVLDRNGKGVANQWVRLSSKDVPNGRDFELDEMNYWNSYFVRTDPDGKYRFSEVAMHNLNVNLLKLDAFVDGHFRGRSKLNVPAASAVVSQDLVLFDAGIIYGKAVSAQGTPINGVAISTTITDFANFSRRDFTTKTRADGSYLYYALRGGVSTTARTIDGQTATAESQLSVDGQSKKAEFGFNVPTFAKVKLNGPRSGVLTRILVNGVEAAHVAGAGTATVGPLRTGSNDITAITSDGDQRSATTVVTTGSVDQVVDLPFTFNQVFVKEAVLAFAGESHLYSVTVKKGDRFTLGVEGFDVGGVSALSQIRAKVFAVDKSLKATDTSIGFGFRRTAGTLGNIDVESDGNYAVSISSRAEIVGGYRTVAIVNGQSVALMPYQDGGTVEGVVYRVDGVTPAADVQLNMQGGGGLGVHLRASTDVAGKYRFTSVPAGILTLSTAFGERVSTSAEVKLDAAGQVVVKDIVLPAETTVQISVTSPPDALVSNSMSILLTDALGPRTLGPLSFAASPVSTVLITTGIGPVLTFDAVHPNNPNIKVKAVLGAKDGQTIPVNLELRSRRISGRVWFGDGTVAPGLQVQVVRVIDQALIAAVTATLEGTYSFSGLPIGVDLFVISKNPGNKLSASVMALGGGDLEQPGKDITFSATGSVAGIAKDGSGLGLAGAAVSVSAMVNGESLLLSSQTDEAGKFKVDFVPVGVPVVVTVKPGGAYGANRSEQQAATVAAMNQLLALPDFIFTSSELRINLLDGDRLKNPVVYRPYSPDCGGNLIVLTTVGGKQERRIDTTNNATPDILPFTALPLGTASIQYFDACTSPDDSAPIAQTVIEIAEPKSYTADVIVPVVTAKVTFADGAPVDPSASFLSHRNSHGQFKTLFPVVMPSDPTRMHFLGVEAGNFVIEARDPPGRLTRRQEAEQFNTSNMAFELVMPASGKVRGTVLKADGSPITDYPRIFLQTSSNTGATVYTRASVTTGGQFESPRVQIGSIDVTTSSDEYAQPGPRGTTYLASEGDVATVDIRPPTPGALRVQLLYPDGSPVQFYSPLYIRDTRQIGNNSRSFSIGSGEYLSGNLAPGEFSIETRAPLNGLYARETAVVESGKTTNISLKLGSATNFYFNALNLAFGAEATPIGKDIFLFAGTQYGISAVYSPVVTGASFERRDFHFRTNDHFGTQITTKLLTGGREVTYGPIQSGCLRQTRRVFGPVSGRFVRVMEMLENVCDQAIRPQLDYILRSSSYSDMSLVDFVTTANYRLMKRPAGAANDPWWRPAFGIVTGTNSSVAFDRIGATYTGQGFELGARESSSVLSYWIFEKLGDADALEVIAKSLVEQTEPNMYEGITEAEKALVKNFTIGQ